jgi:hypothetical protein
LEDREREGASRSLYGLLFGRDVDRRTRLRVWKVVVIVEFVGLLFSAVLAYVLLPLLPDAWLVTAVIGVVVILFVGALVYPPPVTRARNAR